MKSRNNTKKIEEYLLANPELLNSKYAQTAKLFEIRCYQY